MSNSAAPALPAPIEFVIPRLMTRSANQRQHWSVNAEQRDASADFTWSALRKAGCRPRVEWVKRGNMKHLRPMSAGLDVLGWGGAIVTLTRIAPSNGVDDDNLRGALKRCRDGIADALNMGEDGDGRITWDYAQERGPYAVRVRIEPRA